jgi:hypothetical protein
VVAVVVLAVAEVEAVVVEDITEVLVVDRQLLRW